MSWTCPECGKSFRNRNQWHSCYTLKVEDHIRNKSRHIQDLVFFLISRLYEFGPIDLNPVKSVIQVKSGATFLSIKPKKDYVELEFQLGETMDTFPVHKIIRISGKRVLHFVYIQKKDDINEQLLHWLKDSYDLVSKAVK
jgi:hypothetical protein